MLRANPSAPKVMTRYATPMFDDEVSSSQLIKAVSDAAKVVSDHDMSSSTSVSTSVTELIDSTENDLADATVKPSESNAISFADESVRSSSDRTSLNDSGFAKSDLEDISDDDEFFCKLDNPRKKLKLSGRK